MFIHSLRKQSVDEVISPNNTVKRRTVVETKAVEATNLDDLKINKIVNTDRKKQIILKKI